MGLGTAALGQKQQAKPCGHVDCAFRARFEPDLRLRCDMNIAMRVVLCSESLPNYNKSIRVAGLHWILYDLVVTKDRYKHHQAPVCFLFPLDSDMYVVNSARHFTDTASYILRTSLGCLRGSVASFANSLQAPNIVEQDKVLTWNIDFQDLSSVLLPSMQWKKKERGASMLAPQIEK